MKYVWCVVGLLGVGLLASCGSSDSGQSSAPKRETKAKAVSSDKPKGPLVRSSLGAQSPNSEVDFKTYSGQYFSIDIPSSWRIVEEEADKGDFVETKWVDREDKEISFLVDVVPGEDVSAADKALQVRSATRTTSGYIEYGFGPVSLNGRDAVRWDFSVSGDRRVDYLINECEVGYAMLGSAPPRRFKDLRATFTRVVRSLEPVCEASTAPAPSNGDELKERDEDEFDLETETSSDCDSNYGGCVPADAGDVNCPDLLPDEDIQVVGRDVYGLDRDGDGLACES